MTFELVFQHRDFIIINKPAGISVHKDQEAQGLTQLVMEQLGVPRVWLVHRLAAEFSRLFAAHRIQKTYLALSNQKPKKKQGLIVGDMQKTRNGAWKLCQSKENPAITRFDSTSCEPNLRLFILKPQTGKTHQLRVAMKSLGSPILGDVLYGKNAADFDRTYLHAARLEFEYFREKVAVVCLPKEGEIWQKESVQIEIHKTLNEYQRLSDYK